MPELITSRESISPQHYRYEAIAGVTESDLAATAFAKERDFTPRDVEVTRHYLVHAAKYADTAMWPNFWETTALAAIYAREIANELPEAGINSDEIEALGLIHDLGRLMAPGDYYRNDLLAERLAARAELRKDVLGQIHSVAKIVGMSQDSYHSIDDLPPITRVLMASDWLGKRNRDGDLVTPQEIIAAARASYNGYKGDAVWSSTYAGMQALLEGGGREMGEQLFADSVAWCESQGIDFATIRQKVEARLRSPTYQDWMYYGQVAAENLSPHVDEKLRRPHIKHVVFDAGGVLLSDSEQALTSGIARDFGIEPRVVESAMATLYGPEYNANTIAPDEYLPRFFGALALGGVDLQTMRAAFERPDIYRRVADMSGIVAGLSQNPNLTITVLSDSIAAVAGPVRAAIRRLYPVIADERILISSEIGAAKIGSGEAFDTLLQHLGNPDPRTVLMVDDKHITTARKRGIRTFTFQNHPLGSPSAANTLKGQLRQSGMLLPY